MIKIRSESDLENWFKKEKIMTSREVSKKLKVSWNTADKYLLELLVERKVERIKKEGVTLWMKK